jgi:hypothetical protein
MTETHQRIDSPRHDDEADEEVGEREGHDQPVGRRLKALLPEHAGDDLGPML